MSSAGGAPPPPPPPFKFPGMVTHQPKPPSSIVSEPPSSMASIQKAGMPAALAGAMMKDKKPFTYTPGGLDLSEIKSPRMQRRLQRNASLEGVKPSPLAQQPPPSTQSHSPMPPQGMIQVLPMPGVGMAPVVKHQAKEPLKLKRTVCGPAPLPPPFSCGAGGSVEQTEMEEKIPSHTNKNAASNESKPVVPPCPKSSSNLPINNAESNGLLEQNPSDIKANEIPNAPPLPPPNNKKVFREKPKEKLDTFIDLTELENTINSFSPKVNNNEISENNVTVTADENCNGENNADSISEFTDCSSPFYPDEQNSIKNLSDQSQDIASSSDADHIAVNTPFTNQNPISCRWQPDGINNDASRYPIQPEINIQVHHENDVSKSSPDANDISVINRSGLTMPSPNAITTEPEVMKSEIVVNDGLEINPYRSNGMMSNYDDTNNAIIVAPPNTDVANEGNWRFVRQSSLPADNIGDKIALNINNEAIDMNLGAQQHSYEKETLALDKPLPWMVGLKKEPARAPEFVPRPNKGNQRFQRQVSLPQNKEPPQNQYAPWRNPNHRAPNTSNRNRSISPNSMSLGTSGNSYNVNHTLLDDDYGSMVHQNRYATLPSNHRAKGQQMQFQNTTVQQQPPVNQSQHRERIIPIMMETTPPATPQSNFESYSLNSRNNIPAFNCQNAPSLNSYTEHPACGEFPNSSINFTQFSPTSPTYSINATEALHQIQHNLNKLNNGFKTDEAASQNGSACHQGVNVVVTNDSPAVQSKSFNILQKAYETPSSTDSNPEEPRKYTGSNIPSRSFKALQAMTDSQGCNQNHSSS